jgi:predicted ATPase
MGDQLSFLSARGSAALAQHRSLDACIGWSMLLLNDDAHRVLRSLSIVDGRFTLDAALAVAGGGVANRAALETLVDHSLVQFGAADERYVLLDTVRAYAARELAGESDEAYGRLIGWVARLAGTLREALGHGEAAALQRVERDDGVSEPPSSTPCVAAGDWTSPPTSSSTLRSPGRFGADAVRGAPSRSGSAPRSARRPAG